MTQKPLVSIIVPTYNSALHLERCLDSIIHQSVKDYEIIAVDDQSSDETLKILKKYSRIKRCMTVLEMEYKGLAGGARNLGLSIAKGKYISFVDSDDWVDTNFLYYLLKSISQNQSDISLCSVKREYDNIKNSSVRYRYNTENVISGIYAIHLMSRDIDQDISISPIVCNKLYRKQFLDDCNISFKENSLNEDDIFTFSVFLEAQEVSITGMTNYHLYQRRNSVSRHFTMKHIDDLFDAFNTIKEILKDKDCYESMKKEYYAFFEKCFSFAVESMLNSVQDDQEISAYFKYAYKASRLVIPFDEFIDHCGNKRLIEFFG